MASSIMDEVAAAKRAIAEGNALVPHTEDTEPTPAPAPDPDENAEDTPEDEPKAARTPEEVDAAIDDLTARVAALEEALAAANEETAAAASALKEASATIRKLAGVLRDPAKAQALSRGEDAPAAAKTGAEREDVVKTYLAFKPGADASAYYKAHAGEIAAALARK